MTCPSSPSHPAGLPGADPEQASKADAWGRLGHRKLHEQRAAWGSLWVPGGQPQQDCRYQVQHWQVGSCLLPYFSSHPTLASSLLLPFLTQTPCLFPLTPPTSFFLAFIPLSLTFHPQKHLSAPLPDHDPGEALPWHPEHALGATASSRSCQSQVRDPSFPCDHSTLV